MTNVCGKETPSSPYEKNETMKLLGQQRSVELFWGDSQVKREMEQISSARPFEFSMVAASDIFMLGYLHGKRSEREGKKTA